MLWSTCQQWERSLHCTACCARKHHELSLLARHPLLHPLHVLNMRLILATELPNCNAEASCFCRVWLSLLTNYISVPFLNSNRCDAGVGQLNREDLRAELVGFHAELKDTFTQQMKQLSVKDVKPRAMSTVGSEDAGRVKGRHDPLHTQGCSNETQLICLQILNDLGIKELRGEVHCKLPKVPSDFMSVKGFDLADFPGEAEATGPYAMYLAVSSSGIS